MGRAIANRQKKVVAAKRVWVKPPPAARPPTHEKPKPKKDRGPGTED
jgi:hypothetical protein